MASAKGRLLQFHDIHFPSQPSRAISHPTLGFASTDALHDVETTAGDDDMLGYYEDGVKRTLTDEQIAIFRHTEIQRLLRDGGETIEEPAESSPRSGPMGNNCRTTISRAAGGKESSTLFDAQKKEKCEAKSDQRPFNTTKVYVDAAEARSNHHYEGLQYADEDSDPDIPATQLMGTKITPFPRQVIEDEDHGLALTADRTSATDIRKEELTRSEFTWPELRHPH